MRRSQRSFCGRGRVNHTALCGREAGGDGDALAESQIRGVRPVAERLSAARGWGCAEMELCGPCHWVRESVEGRRSFLPPSINPINHKDFSIPSVEQPAPFLPPSLPTPTTRGPFEYTPFPPLVQDILKNDSSRPHPLLVSSLYSTLPSDQSSLFYSVARSVQIPSADIPRWDLHQLTTNDR